MITIVEVIATHDLGKTIGVSQHVRSSLFIFTRELVSQCVTCKNGMTRIDQEDTSLRNIKLLMVHFELSVMNSINLKLFMVP